MLRALLGSGQDPMLKAVEAVEASLLRWSKECWIMKQPGPYHQDILSTHTRAFALQNTLHDMGKG